MIFVFKKTNGQEVFWKGVNEITNEFEFTTDKNKGTSKWKRQSNTPKWQGHAPKQEYYCIYLEFLKNV